MAVAEHTDAAAIRELHEIFETQRAASRRDPFPSLDTRREWLGALASMMLAHRAEIEAAVARDFGAAPTLFTDIIEIGSVAGRAMMAIESLEAWAAPEPRAVDPGMFGTGTGEMRFQPKGVVGNIVPWNFPFELSCGPLVEMLAAGNRVVLKPSEYTPACGELLQRMIRATFPREVVDVVLGGRELAEEFAATRWDHLLYTGNATVGRLVAQAAAANLVPVTLELGGKCPAIVLPGALDAEAVRQILGVKLLKSGQMCVTVDHCLVPRADLDRFVALAREHVAATMPHFGASEDCTGIITERHLDRLLGLLDEARDAGVELVRLDDAEVDRATRRMPATLAIDPPAGIGLMTEEVFGPILPVVPYDDVEDAIDRVNAGERPLGVYVFAAADADAERVLARTVSGGASVNACAMQAAAATLGFGGIGESGYGRHHGIDGFREFSNHRSVFVRGSGDAVDALCPPYGELAQAVVDAALGAA